MDSKFQNLSWKIFHYVDDNTTELELLSAAADLKIEVDRMVERVIELKRQNTQARQLAQRALVVANSVRPK